MSLEEQLSKVKLKSSKNNENKIYTGEKICSNTEEYVKLLQETSIENYYEAIKEFTFESKILSFTEKQIEVLFEENNNYVKWREQKIKKIIEDNPEKKFDFNKDFYLLCAIVSFLGDYDGWKKRNELVDLSQFIEKNINEFNKEKGVFIRLSTVSPKVKKIFFFF
jgi:hypothetical protein